MTVGLLLTLILRLFPHPLLRLYCFLSVVDPTSALKCERLFSLFRQRK